MTYSVLNSIDYIPTAISVLVNCEKTVGDGEKLRPFLDSASTNYPNSENSFKKVFMTLNFAGLCYYLSIFLMMHLGGNEGNHRIAQSS